MAQFNSANGSYQQQAKTLFETNMLASTDGEPISNTNPLPVNLGGANVTITGDVNIPASVEISNDQGNAIPVIGTTPNQLGNLVLRVDDDTVQHTSRNRRKVSTQSLLYFNNVQYQNDLRAYSYSSNNATANAVFSEYDGMTKLQVSNTSGASIIREARNVIPYYPGRQNEIIYSMKLNAPQAGIRRRIGLFDANNGIYFEDSGGTYSCVLRRDTAGGPVEHRVNRADWNVDKLDGTGQSGITANAEAVQMMTIEYEHFGAGQVEFNWIYNNNKYPIHQFNYANANSTPWATTPMLPLRQELTNTTGATGTHEFLVGSSAVTTEGDVGPLGRENSAGTPITGKNLSLAQFFYPVLTIRLKSNRLNGVVIPQTFQAGTLDNTDVFYRVIENGTLDANASFQSAGTESWVEYDVSADLISGGEVIQQGYISSTNQGDVIVIPNEVINQIGRRLVGGESETYTIAVACANANKDAFAYLSWIQLR